MYVQLFRCASCALPQQQEVLVRKNCWQERNRAIISKCPDTQENLLESKPKQKNIHPNPLKKPQPTKKEYNEVFILGVM